ncbi:MAG: restriction endonuclease subunit S [Desulfobacterales bacterium]
MWKKVNLRSITKKTFQWKPTKEPRDSFYYIDVSSVSNETFSIKKLQKINATSAPGRARKIVKWEDTIYATIRPSLKRIAYISNEYDDQIASTAFCVIRPDRNKAFPLYIYYSLLSDSINSKIIELQHGASYPAVTDKDILNQFVHLPSLKEQEKIAAILLKIQQAIEVQESIIEAAQELKKSTMQHVFTYGLRGERTKETEIGRVPESWLLKPAIEVFTLTSGKTRPENIADRKNHETKYPVYGGNGVMGYSTKFFLSSKALVLGRVGEYCGAVHISHDKSWITDNALYSKEWLDSGTSIDYVALYLTFFDLNKLKRRSSQPLISQSIVYQQKIPIPDNQEQQKIVNILKSIDNKIKLHIGKKSGLHDLFKTVLNKLMTGEVIVKDLDINFSEVV